MNKSTKEEERRKIVCRIAEAKACSCYMTIASSLSAELQDELINNGYLITSEDDNMIISWKNRNVIYMTS
jgi:hypothetical protein